MKAVMLLASVATAALAAVLLTREAGAQCPPGTIETGREQRGRDTHVFCAKRATVVKEIDAELVLVDERIARTRHALERYSTRLEGYRESFEEWTRLPVDARKRARLAAKDTVATVLLQNLAQKNAEALSREARLQLSSNRFWGKLEGATLPQIAQAQKDFWQRIEVARTDADVIAALTMFKDSVNLADALPPGDREEALTAILRGIGVVNSATVRNPVIALLISGGELVIADAYAYAGGAIAHRRVEQLLRVSEGELKGLKALTERYRADIDKRSELRARRGKLLSE